jgi:hypothetical protein
MRHMSISLSPARRGLLLILIVRGVLVLAYAAHLPLWQPMDEYSHYQVSRFIAAEGRLPTRADAPDLPPDRAIYVQYEQPFLFYLMSAIPAVLFDDQSQMPTPAPLTQCPATASYRNLVMRGDITPLQRAGWALRGVNMLIGGLAVAALWAAVRVLLPERVFFAHFSALYLALYPPAIALSAWINNDNLLILLGALFLLFAARCQQSSATWRAWLALAVVVIACVLTKLTGLAAVPVFVLLMLWRLRRYRYAVLMGAGALAVGGAGVVALNLARCGAVVCRIYRYSLPFASWGEFWLSWTGLDYVEVLRRLTWSATIPYLFLTHAPPALAHLAVLALLLLGWGFALAYTVRPAGRRLWLAWGLIGGVAGLLLARVWWLQVEFAAMRYFAVALPALMLLLVVGYQRLRVPYRLWGLVLVFGVVNLVAITQYYRPLYQAPVLAQLPATATPVPDYRFPQGLTLLAYRVETGAAWDTLYTYWRTDRPQDAPWVAQADLLGAAVVIRDSCTMVLGTGQWATNAWQAQTIVVHAFTFPQITDADSFRVVLYPLVVRDYLTAIYDARQPIPPTVPAARVPFNQKMP